MSVFNGEKYLDESIESILNQTYKNFEFIIVDDASFDKTSEILRYWLNKDHRVKVITNDNNIGLTKSLNKAIKIAQGKHIARQDGDDISLPERLEKQIEFLGTHPEVKILGTFGYIIDKKGDILGEEILPVSWQKVKIDLIKRNPFMHSSAMIERDIIDRVGGYNEKFKTTQDYELWFRILKIAKGENLPLFLIKKRYHYDMISLKKDRDQIISTIFLQKQAIKMGEYSKFCYVYVLRHYFSLKCPDFLKVVLKKYFLKKRNIFKKVYGK